MMECPKCDGSGANASCLYYDKGPEPWIYCCQHCDGTGEINYKDMWLGRDPENNVQFVCQYRFTGHWYYWNWIEDVWEIADDFEPISRVKEVE